MSPRVSGSLWSDWRLMVGLWEWVGHVGKTHPAQREGQRRTRRWISSAAYWRAVRRSGSTLVDQDPSTVLKSGDLP